MRILGVILAGGRGERMGGINKAFVPLAARPLVEWVIERARPQVNALAINANADIAALGRYSLPVFADTIVPGVGNLDAREGPLAGILAGLTYARAAGGFDAVATFAVDTPLFPGDLVARLSEALTRDHADYAVAATSDGTHPVFGLWRVRSLDQITDMFRKGVRAPRRLADDLREAVALFDDAPAFQNVNRPEDLLALEERLSAP